MLLGTAPVNAPQSASDATKDMIKDSTTASFMADVIEASRQVPVIVDFWAPWCGPCKQLTPLLEKLVQAAKGAVRLVKVNIDAEPALAQQLRIQSVPTIYAFFQGQPLDGFMGALPESQLKAFIERIIKTTGAKAPAQIDALALCAQAAQALANGAVAEAEALFAEALGANPEQPQAWAGLVRCALAQNQAEMAQEILSQIPENLQNHSEIIAARNALELAQHAKPVGELQLLAQAAADKNNMQARYDYAEALFADGQKAEAIEALLQMVADNRAWNDEAARQLLVKIFGVLGLADPLIINARRRLSGILFK